MFQKNIGNTSPNEALLYNYWQTVLILLETGLPWEFIDQMAPTEVTLVLAMIINRKEQEAENQTKGMGMR